MNCIEVHEALKLGHRVFISNKEDYTVAHLIHDQQKFKLISGTSQWCTVTTIGNVAKLVEKMNKMGYSFSC